MQALKAIKYIYICLTLLAVLVSVSTTVGLLDLLPGLCLMWILYLFFSLGSKIVMGDNTMVDYEQVDQINENNRKLSSGAFVLRHKFIFGCLAIVFSFAITYFYTGQTIISVFRNLKSGVSLYGLYQAYHKAQNIGVFSIRKIPFILMNYALNFILIYSFIAILNIKIGKPTFKEVLFLFVLALSFLFFGLARGTGFEVFELTFILLFLLVVRKQSGRMMKKIPLKTKLIILVLIILGVVAFSFIVGSRGAHTAHYTVSREIRYNQNAILSNLLPGLAYMITRLSQYFTFGIFYSSTFLSAVWLKSPITFLGAFFPYGLEIAGISSVPSAVNQVIDQSTNWIPDVVGLVGNLGLLGECLMVFIMGNILKRLERKTDIISMMGVYLITLQMFSLPIGNFILVSSANKLVALTVIGILILRKLSHSKREVCHAG